MRFDNYAFKTTNKPNGVLLNFSGQSMSFDEFIKLYEEIYYTFTYGISDAEPEGTRLGDELWYKAWLNMTRRGLRYRPGKSDNRAYENVTIGYRWLKASNFKKWYNDNIYKIKSDQEIDRLELDKDIRVPGNKVYSEDTCLIVPSRINKFFVSTYKLIKVYTMKRGGRFNTTIKPFEVNGVAVNIVSNSSFELALMWAAEKNKQLREQVIPYFIHLVHPDYVDSPMVQLVLKTLQEYDFVAIEKRNRQIFESVASEIDTTISPEERTYEKLMSMTSTVKEKMLEQLEKNGMIPKVSEQDMVELFDILFTIISRHIKCI